MEDSKTRFGQLLLFGSYPLMSNVIPHISTRHIRFRLHAIPNASFMDRNPYRPSKIQGGVVAARPDRNFASNLLGILLVAGIWLLWSQTFHDGVFIGWLVLGASVGVFIDGLLGNRRVLTPIALCVAPFQWNAKRLHSIRLALPRSSTRVIAAV